MSDISDICILFSILHMVFITRWAKYKVKGIAKVKRLEKWGQGGTT